MNPLVCDCLHSEKSILLCFLLHQLVQYLKMKPAGLMTNLTEECANAAMAASRTITRRIVLIP